jgi:hypothetical protein
VVAYPDPLPPKFVAVATHTRYLPLILSIIDCVMVKVEPVPSEFVKGDV